MVFLLAKALQDTFAKDSNAKSINEEVQNWYNTKPHTFEPIRIVPRGSETENRFPAIWMLLPVHGKGPLPFYMPFPISDVIIVVGLQYYHMAMIVLALSEGSVASSTYETLQKSRQIEVKIRSEPFTIMILAKDGFSLQKKNIRHHLFHVLGLAKSNSKAENTLFTARHSLVACESSFLFGYSILWTFVNS